MVMTTAGELPFYTQNLLINLLADLVYDYQEASSAEPDASNAEPTEG